MLVSSLSKNLFPCIFNTKTLFLILEVLISETEELGKTIINEKNNKYFKIFLFTEFKEKVAIKFMAT